MKKVIGKKPTFLEGHLVALKLSSIEPSQYLDGWPFGPAIKKWALIGKKTFLLFFHYLFVFWAFSHNFQPYKTFRTVVGTGFYSK